MRVIPSCLSGRGLERLGPPVEVGGSLDAGGMGLQRAAALDLDGRQLVAVPQGTMGQRLVAEWPEALGRLQLRGIRGQEHQGEASGNLDLPADVPASPVEHDLHLGTSPEAGGELGQRKCATETVGSSSQKVRPVGGWTKA